MFRTLKKQNIPIGIHLSHDRIYLSEQLEKANSLAKIKPLCIYNKDMLEISKFLIKAIDSLPKSIFKSRQATLSLSSPFLYTQVHLLENKLSKDDIKEIILDRIHGSYKTLWHYYKLPFPNPELSFFISHHLNPITTGPIIDILDRYRIPIDGFMPITEVYQKLLSTGYIKNSNRHHLICHEDPTQLQLLISYKKNIYFYRPLNQKEAYEPHFLETLDYLKKKVPEMRLSGISWASHTPVPNWLASYARRNEIYLENLSPQLDKLLTTRTLTKKNRLIQPEKLAFRPFKPIQRIILYILIPLLAIAMAFQYHYWKTNVKNKELIWDKKTALYPPKYLKTLEKKRQEDAQHDRNYLTLKSRLNQPSKLNTLLHQLGRSDYTQFYLTKIYMGNTSLTLSGKRLKTISDTEWKHYLNGLNKLPMLKDIGYKVTDTTDTSYLSNFEIKANLVIKGGSY